MLHWLRQYSFVRYAIIAQEIAIDQHGIHVQTGVLQPNMISTLMMAPVCRNWYTAALPIVENKSWIRPWRTMRTLLARDVSVMVQVTEASKASLAQEEICVGIESSHHTHPGRCPPTQHVGHPEPGAHQSLLVHSHLGHGRK